MPFGVVEGREILYLEEEEEDGVVDDGNFNISAESTETSKNTSFPGFDSTKYTSVLSILIAKVNDPSRRRADLSLDEKGMDEEGVRKLCQSIHRKIEKHRGAGDMKISNEEEKWLIEKLAWFGMCKSLPFSFERMGDMFLIFEKFC